MRSGAPQSWLSWAGGVRLLFGLNAHRRWHYTLDQQPVRFVRWFCRSVDAPKSETLANLGHSLAAWLTGNKPPWTLEAEEAELEELEEPAPLRPPVAPRSTEDVADYVDLADSHAMGGVYHGHGHHGATGTVASAVKLRNAKRRLTALGVLGVYVIWCVPDLSPHACMKAACMHAARCRLADARVRWFACATTRRAIFAWCVLAGCLHALVCVLLLLMPLRPLQVHLRLRNAVLQAAGRRGADLLRAQLGRQLRCEQRLLRRLWTPLTRACPLLLLSA
jgi:hypothetical protein